MSSLYCYYLPAVGFAQSKYLYSADSILVAESNKTSYTMIYVSDSSNAVTDTLIVEKYVPKKKVWATVAIMDMTTHDDWYASIIPGDGVAKWYLINAISMGDNIRIRKTNVVAASRTKKTYVEYDKR